MSLPQPRGRFWLLEVAMTPGKGLDQDADPPSQGNFSIQEDISSSGASQKMENGGDEEPRRDRKEAAACSWASRCPVSGRCMPNPAALCLCARAWYEEETPPPPPPPHILEGVPEPGWAITPKSNPHPRAACPHMSPPPPSLLVGVPVQEMLQSICCWLPHRCPSPHRFPSPHR